MSAQFDHLLPEHYDRYGSDQERHEAHQTSPKAVTPTVPYSHAPLGSHVLVSPRPATQRANLSLPTEHLTSVHEHFWSQTGSGYPLMRAES
jgi:hypothetical protein